MNWTLTAHEKKAIVFVVLLAFVGGGALLWRRWRTQPASIFVVREQLRQRIEEKARKFDTRPATPLFDLNTALERDLMRIPTVGHVMASRIVQYRRLKGSFKDVSELDQVPGIGSKRIKEIAPYVFIQTDSTISSQAAKPAQVPRTN